MWKSLNFVKNSWNSYLLPERGVVIKAELGISSVHLDQASYKIGAKRKSSILWNLCFLKTQDYP